MINYHTENGCLVFTADNEGRADLAEATRQNGHHGALCLVLDETVGNGLEMVPPERIFALTDMPMFSESFYIEDDDSSTIDGPLYGFPDYWRESEWERLRNTGRVVFPMVAEYEGWRFPSPYKPEGGALAVETYRRCVDPEFVPGESA